MSFWRFGLLVALAHAQQCVTKQLISPGDGITFPKAGDTVSMHYTGTLASTGAKFDSSRDRGREFSTQIGVGQVIRGWDQGVPQMSLGERATLRISASCGYGAAGSPPTIPANADLVFDVQLNGINGQRATTASSVASAPAAVSSASFGSSISAAPVTAAATLSVSASSGALPRCIKSSCGHAISFDPSGATRPLCLCNPLCEQMKNTPGVLPCCPGLQEVCLDPYRSPSEMVRTSAPTPAFASATSFVAPAASASFGARATASNVGSTNFAAVATTPFLPTCRPNSCGKGMASGVNSNVAVCACDVSCLSPSSSLPCCTSFREVCQSSLSATTALSASAFSSPLSSSLSAGSALSAQSAPLSSSLGASSALSASSAPLSQLQFSTQFAAAPAASATATAGCALGKTKWEEQPNCDKKRYAIQNGKCKKTCLPVDPTVNIQSYPTGQEGKDACAAALAQCQF